MKLYQALLPLAAAMMIAACGNQATAENVVAQANNNLDSLRAQAAQVAPAELQTAEATLADMQHSFAERKYSDVVRESPQFNAQLQTIHDTIVSRQTAAAAAARQWTELNEEVPKTVAAIEVRVEGLDATALPKGMTPESLETVKTDLETLKTTWAEATAAADAGHTVEATDKGRIVQAKAGELMSTLGISPTVASAG